MKGQGIVGRWFVCQCHLSVPNYTFTLARAKPGGLAPASGLRNDMGRGTAAQAALTHQHQR